MMDHLNYNEEDFLEFVYDILDSENVDICWSVQDAKTVIYQKINQIKNNKEK